MPSRITGFMVIIVLVTFSVKIALNHYPEITERIYYDKIYTGFRLVWDSVVSYCPFPLFYIWLLIPLALIIGLLMSILFKKYRNYGLFKLYFFILAMHYVLFYWTWGFNYSRINLGDRWNVNNPIQDSQFIEEFYHQSAIIDSLRSLFKDKIDHYAFHAPQMEQHIRILVQNFHKNFGFNTFKKIRCRDLNFNGILLIWSTSGVYLPFIGESQIDGGLHDLSKPFTMAHEFCHSMGWTHEGDCNFLAYLICKQSPDPVIRYSAELNYWRYLYANASRAHPNHFQTVSKLLSVEVLDDLHDINQKNNQYPEVFPLIRAWLYDWFLKQHGMPGGDKSYAEIIRMVIHYKSKQI